MDERGSIEVRDLRPEEVPDAVDVLARGMRDNPLHVAAYGEDPERRVRCHARLMRCLFRVFTTQQPICAVRDGVLVGVTGVAPAGTCQPTATQRIRLLPDLLALGPRTAARVGRWLSSWAQHDPEDAHVHLGPLAVDAHLQGHGIGSLIMRRHCRRLDGDGDVGYLETDKAENVRFLRTLWLRGDRGGARDRDCQLVYAPRATGRRWFVRRAPRMHPHAR